MMRLKLLKGRLGSPRSELRPIGRNEGAVHRRRPATSTRTSQAELTRKRLMGGGQSEPHQSASPLSKPVA